MALYLNHYEKSDRYIIVNRFCYSIFILTFFAFDISAQNISPSRFNFGKVKNWSNPDAEFYITNTGSTPFMFLPQRYDPQVFVSVPSGQIQPGQQTTVKVKYYTREGGKFERSIPVFINTSSEPLMLTIKGTIVSFAPDALSMCPQLGGSEPNMSGMKIDPEIEVVDAQTGLQLTDADILITGPTKSYAFENTRKPVVKARGIPIGLYYIDCSKEGYEHAKLEKYFSKSTYRIRIELTPTGKPLTGSVPEEDKKDAYDEKSPSSDEDDDMIVIENNPYDEKEAIERIRKMMNKKFKGKEIIERDVVVINEPQKDSSITPRTEETVSIPKPEDGEILADGSLNPSIYALNNIVFLIDASGSMYREDKLPLLKIAMKNLVDVLRPDDRLTIIIYRSEAEVILQGVPGNQKEKIYHAIDSLEAKGNSYGTEGLYAAYENATYGFIPGGNNQIILASDGMFNSADFNEKSLYRLASRKADEGIILSAIGFGNLNRAISFMKNLSAKGEGSFLQISSETDANSALVDEIKKQSSLSGK